MEKKEYLAMLDWILQPAFSVSDHRIEYLNPAARGLLEPGTDVRTLLETGRKEYEAFQKGCLYLKLNLGGTPWGASVSRLGQQDIFLLEPEADNSALQALALASMELRRPLSNAMASAERLTVIDDPVEFQARLNRGLNQLHRILNNMSDVPYYAENPHLQMQNLTTMFDEIFRKAQDLVSRTGRTMTYQGLPGEAEGLADRDQLERAVLCLLSNALKFTGEDGIIDATLTRRGNLLQLCVQDNGTGIPEDLLPHIFRRYQRQATIEDGRHGLGLGLVLVRTVALNHGGTVLIDQPGETGTRVTMTLQLRKGKGDVLRSPIIIPSGQDPALIELSESLPHELYRS